MTLKLAQTSVAKSRLSVPVRHHSGLIFIALPREGAKYEHVCMSIYMLVLWVTSFFSHNGAESKTMLHLVEFARWRHQLAATLQAHDGEVCCP